MFLIDRVITILRRFFKETQFALLFKKYREQITYIIFGVLTTLINFLVLKAFTAVFGEALYLVWNIFAWVFAVAFAYVTNKLFVFGSKSWKKEIVIKEAVSFTGSRLLTLGLEELGMWLMVDILEVGRFTQEVAGHTVSGVDAAKLVMMVVVIVLNYVLSKLLTFRKKREAEE